MSASAFFRTTLVAVLLAVANEHGSARAEQLAHEVDPAQLSGELDEDALPITTADGRIIPRGRRAQIRNTIPVLRERGLIPPCPGVSDETLRNIAGELAGLDRGAGCYASLEYLARKPVTGRSPTQIRLVAAYLEAQGFCFNFQRVKADDRKIGGAARPVTDSKTTVRKIFPIPPRLLEKLSDDEVLDLLAFGEKKPTAMVPASTSSGSSSSAPSGPAEWAPLLGPLAQIAELTSHKLTPGWAEQEGTAAGLEDLEDIVAALADLVGHLQEEKRKGTRPSRDRAHVEARVKKYFEGRRRWIDKAGPQARASAEAAAREAANRAIKSPEQLERESGGQARAAPAQEAPRRASAGQRARLLVSAEPDARTRAALTAEIDEAERQIGAAANVGERIKLERSLERLVERLVGARAPPGPSRA